MAEVRCFVVGEEVRFAVGVLVDVALGQAQIEARALVLVLGVVAAVDSSDRDGQARGVHDRPWGKLNLVAGLWAYSDLDMHFQVF